MRRNGNGYVALPFSGNRRLVSALATISREWNTVHTITEVDIHEARRRIRRHRDATGERLSVTGYVVTCLARALTRHPQLNAIRRGRKLLVLDDITINTLIEREIAGEQVPEPWPVRAAQDKSYRQIHDEIRAAQRHESRRLGTLSGTPAWVRLLPGPVMRWALRWAARSPRMAMRYGAVGVTAIGMFGAGATWALPMTAGTVAVTVGGIVRRPVFRDGALEEREQLCLTLSFNHDIVDGGPATRFMKDLTELLSSGDIVDEATGPDGL